MYCVTNQGVKLSMPRYYKNKIYDDEQREFCAYVSLKNMRKREQDLIDKMNLYDIPLYFHNKFQSQKAATEQMYRDAEKNRLI